MSVSPPVWVLLGTRTGDNNQLLRLARELGRPFRAIELEYSPLHRLPPRLLGASLATLTPKSRRELRPPWPKLVLGIGYRSVPVGLAIRNLSGGKSKLVRLGNPRVDPRRFDLVITTAQYRVPQAGNVIRLPVGISTAPKEAETREEKDWLAKLPRPHRLVLVGGNTFMWTLPPKIVAEAAGRIAAKPGGSVIAISSSRSDGHVLDTIAERLRGSDHGIVRGKVPRYAVILNDADEIYVTADSIAMISDAIGTGKPVGLIDPEMNGAGRFLYALQDRGLPVPVRDIRAFWRSIAANGIAGTIDEPSASQLADDPLATAAGAVRSLLDS